MDRIDHASAYADLFGSGKDGFTDGDPVNGVEATVATDDFLNGLQEEVLGIIEGAGVTPDSADLGQVEAIRRSMSWRSLFSILTNSDALTTSGTYAEIQEGAVDIEALIPANTILEGTRLRIVMLVNFTIGGSGTPPTAMTLGARFDQATDRNLYTPIPTARVSYGLGETFRRRVEFDVTFTGLTGALRYFRFASVIHDDILALTPEGVSISGVGALDTVDPTATIGVKMIANSSGGTASVTATALFFTVDICEDVMP